MWIQIAIFVVGLLVAGALQRRPAVPAPASLEEFDFPQSEEGTPQRVIFGECWVDGWMVLGVGNFGSAPIRK